MSVLGPSGYKDVFGPRFFFEVNGGLAEDIAKDVTRFEYEDEAGKNDKLTLTVNNRGLKYIDDRRFEGGAEFLLRWGYVNDLSEKKRVTLVRAKPSFPRSGVPTITFVAFDLRAAMNKGGNPVNHGPVSSSDVAKKIARRYDLKFEVEESRDARSQSRIQPANISDIQYLQDLAKALNWDFYVEGNTLYFRKKDYDSEPALEFTYFTDHKGTLIDFDPDVDLAKPGKVGTARADDKTADASQADGHANKKLGHYDVITDPTKEKLGKYHKEAIVKASHETDKKVAEMHADAIKQRISMAAVKASATIIGTPRVKARTIIRLNGIGRTYSGNWRVEGSTHTIAPTGDVYITKLKLSRNALNMGTKKSTEDGATKNDKHGAGDGEGVLIGTDPKREKVIGIVGGKVK